MVLVIDVACRMLDYDKVEVRDNKGKALFDGRADGLKRERETHRLVVDNLIPECNKLVITIMS